MAIIVTDHTPSHEELQCQYESLRKLFWVFDVGGTDMLISRISGTLGAGQSVYAYAALREHGAEISEPLAEIMDAIGRRMDEIEQELEDGSD